MPSDLSIFVDESGGDDLKCRYYLLTLVMHDQSQDITESIRHYEQSLAQMGLPNIPLHTSPLMNGHDEYRHLSAETRSRLLTAFRVFFRHLPITYKAFTFKTSEYRDTSEVANAMRRKLVDYIFDNLSFFQSFENIKIYYDGGQGSITQALHKAIDYALFKTPVTYRPARAQEYRLAQAADYICTIELAALKYHAHQTTATDEKFFGGWSRFKKGVLREVRSKMR